ncbi:Putative flippase GtrA (transmembrane translocase of bactoprenol-linked glucose) (GtrA) (PDB:5MLZ) (PUBMED:24710389) [Commensalibacter communis]|uniref:GtrA family protein n=2 Tax=Commensalibacter communis TaxID=2972786 RepID=UPI0022FF6A16|nr:Putative flippase GtrA (transmembrane translocase of bactoprenol-linked glucose) (GtrA) (PDB:5MLZ) (PUBMED:24710389) [Commensalibacter communis]CAI3931356.1 Putative flippase GtrA (transmembrane translocase of bactoprenol-linked glucose) (GtrA) (PDB:5MLZ) (PUBMED:24710389) [Commensalibacter communis]
MWVVLSKYIIVGLANTLLTMIVIIALTYYGIGLYVANASGYVVGIIFSFILNSVFTFSATLSFTKLLKFLIVCFISYLVNLIAMKVFFLLCPNKMHFAEYRIYLAQFWGMGFYTITGFILNKMWVMK